MNLIQAYLIYNGKSESYVADGTLITINCQQLQAFSPVKVWLQRSPFPGTDGTGIQYQPTFSVNSTDLAQYGTNLIQGYWIQQADGSGMMIDIVDANTLISACNACCDSSPAVTLARYYSGGIAAFTDPASAKFCIYRLDDGSASAHNDAALAYTSQYTGSFKLVGNLSGTSRYEITSYTGWPPFPVGNDTVVTGGCP